jgi:hypothetical protein
VTCRVCRQRPDFRAIQRTARRIWLYGVVPYGVCLCGMEVLPERNDRNYRERWKRALKRVLIGTGNQG